MQYISYIRTSTKTQHNGLDAQRYAINRYIDMSGGEVIKEYMEQESGSKDNRTELSKGFSCQAQHTISLKIYGCSPNHD